jgi:hypothetical protein
VSNFLPYERVYRCGDDGDGAKNMLYYLDRESPWAGVVTNFGVCNCRGTGSGSLSQHSRCRAFDAGLPLVNGRANPLGDAIVKATVPIAGELGLTELIWNRRRYHRGAPWGEPYSGVSPHIDHIHGAHSGNATRLLTVAHVRNVYAGVHLLTPQLTAEQWAGLRRLSAADLYNRVLPLPVMWLDNIRSPQDVVTLRKALNLVLNENLPADGVYDADQDWQVQRWQHNVESFLGGNPIPENRGTFADATKVYLAKALANIRDGK